MKKRVVFCLHGGWSFSSTYDTQEQAIEARDSVLELVMKHRAAQTANLLVFGETRFWSDAFICCWIDTVPDEYDQAVQLPPALYQRKVVEWMDSHKRDMDRGEEWRGESDE